jgi:hypothetical protein
MTPSVTMAARVTNAAFSVVSAAYCVLSASSFSYEQFIRPQLIGWLPDLVALHHVFFWMNLGVTLLSLAVVLRRLDKLAWAYLVAGLSAGQWLTRNPILANLGPDRSSLVPAVLFLLPMCWLAVIDHRTAGRSVESAPVVGRRVLAAVTLASIVVWAVYTVALPLRLGAWDIDLAPSALVMASATSLVFHVAAFALISLVLLTGLAIASRTGRPGADYWTLAALSSAALTLVFYTVVAAALSFRGPDALVVSLCLSLALVMCWSGIAVQRASTLGDRPVDAIDLWLSPIAGAGSQWALAGLAALPLVAFAVSSGVARLDWNFLLQKIGVLAVWVLAFGWIYAASWRWPGHVTPSAVSAAAAGLAALVVVALAAPTRLAAWSGDSRLDPEFVFDRYAVSDPSYRLIRDMLRARSGEAAAFYTFLKAHSTIGPVPVAPVDVAFADGTSTLKNRPHIFLFVIDSLRRDYLSPYNAEVMFTPAIADLARDSYVFDRAFTRYGATGLSVPSIWAGGLLLHKQYVLPFEPMNALAKLLDAGGYRRIIGRDSIVSRLVPQTPSLVELDRGRRNMEFDFCRTLEELEHELVAGQSDPRPVFGYTLPQNVHIAKSFERPVPAGEHYPGFFEPVASVVYRLDGCVGNFVSFLKRAGLYEQSIIILTSDHGDSLGEEGRWGHAYTVFPEVMRIPLIVHLPPSLTGEVTTDLSRVSFSTDITPTLYALAGLEPKDLGPIYGAPLFVAKGQSLEDRRRQAFLLASSYGAVYGMLRHNGRVLYIADAVDGRDFAYEIGGAGASRLTVTDSLRALNERLIREQVTLIADEYRFRPLP